MSHEEAYYKASRFSKPVDLQPQDEELFYEYAKIALSGMVLKTDPGKSFNDIAIDAAKIAHSMTIQHRLKFQQVIK